MKNGIDGSSHSVENTNTNYAKEQNTNKEQQESKITVHISIDDLLNTYPELHSYRSILAEGFDKAIFQKYGDLHEKDREDLHTMLNDIKPIRYNKETGTIQIKFDRGEFFRMEKSDNYDKLYSSSSNTDSDYIPLGESRSK